MGALTFFFFFKSFFLKLIVACRLCVIYVREDVRCPQNGRFPRSLARSLILMLYWNMVLVLMMISLNLCFGNKMGIFISELVNINVNGWV